MLWDQLQRVASVRPFLFSSISWILFWPRDMKLDGWMHHHPKVCRVPKPGHRNLLLTLDCTYFKIPFRSISRVLFWRRDTKLDGWMRHRPKVCHVPKPGHCDLLFMLDRTYFKIPFCTISLVLFDIGTPNLMGGCIIAQRCVAYQNQVTVTYFSRLTGRTSKFRYGPYLLYYLT